MVKVLKFQQLKIAISQNVKYEQILIVKPICLVFNITFLNVQTRQNLLPKTTPLELMFIARILVKKLFTDMKEKKYDKYEK